MVEGCHRVMIVVPQVFLIHEVGVFLNFHTCRLQCRISLTSHHRWPTLGSVVSNKYANYLLKSGNKAILSWSPANDTALPRSMASLSIRWRRAYHPMLVIDLVDLHFYRPHQMRSVVDCLGYLLHRQLTMAHLQRMRLNVAIDLPSMLPHGIVAIVIVTLTLPIAPVVVVPILIVTPGCVPGHRIEYTQDHDEIWMLYPGHRQRVQMACSLIAMAIQLGDLRSVHCLRKGLDEVPRQSLHQTQPGHRQLAGDCLMTVQHYRQKVDTTEIEVSE